MKLIIIWDFYMKMDQECNKVMILHIYIINNLIKMMIIQKECLKWENFYQKVNINRYKINNQDQK